MFLLVPAHPGFPGQIPQSRKTVVCVVCLCGTCSEVTVKGEADIIISIYTH